VLALRSFREDDRVKAVLTSINKDKQRISFSMKPSHFSEEGLASEEDSEDGDDQPGALGVVDEDTHMSSDVEDDDREEGESPSEEEALDDDAMSVDIDLTSMLSNKPSIQTRKALPVPSLQLKGGFQWSGGDPPEADPDEGISASSDESDAGGVSGKKKKKKRKQIELDLTADMHTKAPESNADFERVLLGSPNSSYLWIQYMSFQLQLAEIDKARAIAQRALATISFREEQEKLNVWLALLNLENVYGTDESLEVAFRDAARHNDSKTVHLRLASILEQSEKYEVRLSSVCLPTSAATVRMLISAAAESGGAVQTHVQEVRSELQGLVPLCRVLL